MASTWKWRTRATCAWIPVAFAAAAVAGCTSATGLSEDPIVGDWAWVRSTGGIAGVTQTPATEGYSVTLRFTSAGEAEWVQDGTLRQRTTYQVAIKSEGGTPVWVVTYAQPLFGFEQQDATFPTSRTLVLTDPCCDGFVSEFVRSAGP